jgi:hypothetical protein
MSVIARGIYSQNWWMFVGDMPDPTVIAALTTWNSPSINGNLACYFNNNGFTNALVDTTTFPPRWKKTALPTTKTATSAKDGTITWALVAQLSYPAYAAVPVTNTGGGGVIEVDNVSVAVGSVVTLTGWNFAVNRS